jgi:MFS family permease
MATFSDLQLHDMANVIHLAVAPVFLLAGVSGITNVLAGRLARAIDRARALEAQTKQPHEATAEDVRELNLLGRRAGWITLAMTLAVVCALLVSLLIAVAFLDAFLPLNLAPVIAFLFVAAMFCFSGSLLAFLREIQMAYANLRIGMRTCDTGRGASRPD